MLDGNKLKFGDLLVEKGYDFLYMFLEYYPRTLSIKLLKIPSDIYIPSVPVWKPDYESFMRSDYVRDHRIFRPISYMDYADPYRIKKHNDKANHNLNLGKWLYNCSLYPLSHHYFVGGRGCGKTKLIRQILNSTYGLASANNWAERYLYTTDKLYDTLGIKDYLNKVYGDPMTAKRSASLKEMAKEYDCDCDLIIDWFENINFKEEEKNKMADQKQVYTFKTVDYEGKYREITLEKDFKNDEYPYHARVYTIKNDDSKCFTSTFGYRYWEQLETQLMYDLAGSGIVIVKDRRDEVTHELHRAKNVFRGYSYANSESPYQGGIIPEIMEFRNGKDITLRKAKPFEVMPKIEKVIFNPPATIVKWKDGTKTVVKCQDDDEFDWEKGLAMAYVKRAFNNERTYYGLFKKNEPDVILPNSNVKYDPNEVKKLELFVPKDVVITEKGLHDAIDALTKACDDKIDEMLGDIDISKEMEFIETGKWPEKGDKNE